MIENALETDRGLFFSCHCCRERLLLPGNVHTKWCFQNPHFQSKKLRASDRNVILRILLPIYLTLGPRSLVWKKGKSSWARASNGLPLFNLFSRRLLVIFSPLSPNVQPVYLINAVVISKVWHNRLGHALWNQMLHLDCHDSVNWSYYCVGLGPVFSRCRKSLNWPQIQLGISYSAWNNNYGNTCFYILRRFNQYLKHW